MHIDGERGRRRAPRQPALLLANLRQCQAEPTEFLWYRRKQILGLAELVEILEKEPVLPVVPRGALGAALQQVIGQHRTDRPDHHTYPLLYYRIAGNKRRSGTEIPSSAVTQQAAEPDPRPASDWKSRATAGYLGRSDRSLVWTDRWDNDNHKMVFFA